MKGGKEVKKKIKHRDSIVTSCANIVLPICLVLGVYVVLHGHLSPGGGFQGGVLIAAAVAIIFLAYGDKKLEIAINVKRLKAYENIGALGFVLLGFLGIIYGVSFFRNVFHDVGILGKLYSSGTIFWMNFAVGFKVLAGVGFLLIIMVKAMNPDEKEE